MSEFKWNQKLSEEIFKAKYMLHGEKTPEEVFKGISKEIASTEKADKKKKIEEEIFEQLTSGKLIPAGRILANARPESPMKNYNNCFTIDVEDSMEGIYDSLKEDAMISKMGGGVGFDISKLRPKSTALSKGGQASGVISFLRIFDQSAKTIITGGHRRSAHIALLDISHPDIEEFITVKQGDHNKELTQFNISVKITDAFIKAVEDDADWDLVFNGIVYKTVKARYLNDLVSRNSFIHNEPGIFNQDLIEKYNNGYWAFKMDRVNPCGELVMPPYSLCCLSAINLSKFVKEPFTDKAEFDFPEFEKTVRLGIRFLDNVLDKTDYPLDKIEKFSKQWRRIGLGFTALGNTFAMMKTKYGSDESLKLGEKIAKALRDNSYSASADLAAEKGPFPACDIQKLIKANFIKELPADIRKKIEKNGMRNIQLNTVAPTGTTSLSVGQNCSSGIEPMFALQYDRNVRTGVDDETRSETVYDYSWMEYLALQDEDIAVADAPDYFVTTVDIDPRRAVDMQAVFQKYIDHSISKTLNLPPGTTFEEYKDLYMYAYKQGLKGFTTFNPDGSMKGILEYSEKKDNQTIKRVLGPERPSELPCEIHQIKVKGQKYIILVGILNGSLYEVFAIDDPENHIDLKKYSGGLVKKAGKGRYDLHVESGPVEATIKDFTRTFDSPNGSLSRFLSMALRHGTPLQFIIDQLNKDTNFEDFERALSRVLKRYIIDGEEVIAGENKCAECEGKLIFRDGCVTCPECGWSKCS
ncbi:MULTISPECIES: adenosylcobalamin-dependent ribonucleoside-diphosphate reductase [unclassified Oceanispirochaeta]|uniref:adenosylcobalamin-dependent ribonucleoside-diphosphate reductase n=1 Tax=unclassified Oceanispirochaeta TaxID=2635722 RepID=UPI000E090157|nr:MULTISPECIES: adenosylcobalamin-dependent ribonucleoside-diphosphate reductase [unclassified Oceanispirochaeta]MBF9015680.1 adenosylcobalamin-dependent ribonucleoside-diphosphate reductase [Oceanispirochaeta sp. M2]NPD73454.1 adenosylcobalamin-dependent ribonucleoside-diphosphate reductase [Oceanispirochaeta sp. M1]RDG30927.1 adenosylcobalamin-dependent ribonucleoside-diphosphate reductase [Oceanispirochaeta sp. M1]